MEQTKKLALIALLMVVGFAASAPAAVPTADDAAKYPGRSDAAVSDDGFNSHASADDESYNVLPTWRIDLAGIPF